MYRSGPVSGIIAALLTMAAACSRAMEPAPVLPAVAASVPIRAAAQPAARPAVSVPTSSAPTSPAPTAVVSSPLPAVLATDTYASRLTVYGHLVPDAEKRDYWSVNIAQNLFVASRVGGEAHVMQFELNLDKLPGGIGKGDVTLIGALRVVLVPAVSRGEQAYGKASRTYLDVERVLP
jgi:hypothetical protein